jgi:prolyl-tRNA synthetase
LGADTFEMASDLDVFETFGAHFGSLGPIDIDIKTLVDRQLQNFETFVVGANQDGKHILNVNFGRDLIGAETGDFTIAKVGNISADKTGPLKFNKGIEIGHVFKLGTRYSAKLGAQVQGEDGSMIDLIMGSYGIGVSRLLSAIIEQNVDDRGIIWPKNVAPFDVHVIPVKYDDQIQRDFTDEIVSVLEDKGLSVLVDDRNERPGVKFADSDLIGSPLRIVVGRDAASRTVEVKLRDQKDEVNVQLSQGMSELEMYL